MFNMLFNYWGEVSHLLDSREESRILYHPSDWQPSPHLLHVGANTAPTTMFGKYFGRSPPVVKHGVLENGPFMSNFRNKTSIHRGFSIASLITRGYVVDATLNICWLAAQLRWIAVSRIIRDGQARELVNQMSDTVLELQHIVYTPNERISTAISITYVHYITNDAQWVLVPTWRFPSSLLATNPLDSKRTLDPKNWEPQFLIRHSSPFCLDFCLDFRTVSGEAVTQLDSSWPSLGSRRF